MFDKSKIILHFVVLINIVRCLEYTTCPAPSTEPGLSCTCSSNSYLNCLVADGISKLPKVITPSNYTFAMMTIAPTTQKENLVSIYSEAFQGFRTTHLKVTNLAIYVVEPDAFVGLGPELGILDLSGNDLEIINPGAFQTLNKLDILDIQYNKLILLRDGAFEDLNELRVLVLDHNAIEYIEPNTFAPLKNLQALYLNWNSLQNIQPIFTGLSNLEVLHLSYNTLHDGKELIMHQNVFQPLKRLAILYLSGNNFTTIPGSPLRQMINLQKLSLENNLIQEVQPGDLDGMAIITELNLSHNRLLFPPLHRAMSLAKLRSLDLRHNYIQFLPPRCCTGLPELRELQVANNMITHVAANALMGLTRLNVLNLANNKLKTLDQDALHGAMLVGKLQLHGNEFVCNCDLSWLRDYVKDCWVVLEKVDYCTCPAEYSQFTLIDFPVTQMCIEQLERQVLCNYTSAIRRTTTTITTPQAGGVVGNNTNRIKGNLMPFLVLFITVLCNRSF